MIDFAQVKLSPGLSYTLRSMSRGKSCPSEITNSCQVPHFVITVDSESNCMLCGCEGWLPIPVGKVRDFDSIETVFASPIARMIQQDIDQKKFTWCAVEQCGVLHHDNLNSSGSYYLNINIDDSCNLSCPSCRREIIMSTSGPEFDKKVQDTDHILSWLEKFEHPIEIALGGSGDALASLICRNLIINYKYRSTQKFSITTNGLLLKKVMPKSAILPAVCSYSVSVDAGSKTVYENVRRPGKWEVLLENLEWLSQNKNTAKVSLNFVLQNANYEDLPNFVELCRTHDFLGRVQPLNDWGTWNSRAVPTPDAWTVANGAYPDHNVTDPQHKNHHKFVDTINKIRQQQYKFISFNSFFDQFQ